MSEDEGGEAGDLFKEPADFYEPEKKPTVVHHRTLQGQELTLHLVGHNPLWGHLLWQAGCSLADYLETNADTLVKNRSILELGAGAGLPSLICALNGASQVVVTDYPDPELIENLRHNISANSSLLPSPPGIHAEGYLWGASTSALLHNLPPAPPTSNKEATFDTLILADLLFNHSEHSKLLSTILFTLKKSADAKALVFFTPYRPWLLEKDLAFFGLAREGGLVVEKVFENVLEKVMFEGDRGDELLRRTVFGYVLRWPESVHQS